MRLFRDGEKVLRLPLHLSLSQSPFLEWRERVICVLLEEQNPPPQPNLPQ
jgi:hypothetical protein